MFFGARYFGQRYFGQGYWGASPDEPPATPTDRGGDGFPGTRQRRKFRKATRDQLEKLLFSKTEEPPRPTPKRVRAVQRDIVEQVAGGLLGPQKQEIARVVKREIVQSYQPSMDWNALIAAYEHVMRVAEEARTQQEIDDDDEEFLLMYA